jgi:putative membrane protein
MAYMMDDMWGGYSSGGFGFPIWRICIMLFWLFVFLVIAYLVYKDAKTRGMNGLLWAILVLIPFVGILFLIIYVVIRETTEHNGSPEKKSAMDIVKERYAKGEISSEEFQKITEDLKK